MTDHLLVAMIQDTGSTNSPGIDVVVYCDASAERTIDVATYDGPVSSRTPAARAFEAGSAGVVKFLADLDSVRDVSALAADHNCPKSVSFSSETYVSALGRSSVDVQCLLDPTPAQADLVHDCFVLLSD